MSGLVRWQTAGDGVAVVTIDNPPLNLLSGAIKQGLLDAAGSLAASWPDVRAVVLTGAGDRAFSAGADMKEFPERVRSGGAEDASRFGHRIAAAWLNLPQVTIAAVAGHCMGGGAEIALFCDFRVAGADARMGLPEVTRGWFPGNGGTQLLPRLVGRQVARRLLLSGQALEAEAALRIGLVDRVVPSGETEAVAVAWARELALRPARAVAAVKRLLSDPGDLAAGLEAEAAAFGEIFRTADAAEGIAAFLEKRPPSFTHRR